MHHTKFKHIFSATILRSHDDFIAVIENEPSSKYKNATYHLFNQHILLVLVDIADAMYNFCDLKKKSLVEFSDKNVWALMYQR